MTHYYSFFGLGKTNWTCSEGLKTLGYLHRGTFLLKQEGNATAYLTESDSAGLSPGSDSAVAWPGDLKHVPSWLMQALAASLCK